MGVDAKRRECVAASWLNLLRRARPEPSDQPDCCQHRSHVIPGKLKNRADQPDGDEYRGDEWPDAGMRQHVPMMRLRIHQSGDENFAPVAPQAGDSNSLLQRSPQRVTSGGNGQLYEIIVRWWRS